MNVLNKGVNKYTAIYRCSGDIANLKIRVKVKEIVQQQQNINEDEEQGWTAHTFRWQQKVFSRSEIDYYRNEKNCVTDLEKKYHLEAAKLEEIDASLNVFSYVNDDEFSAKESKHTFCEDKEIFEEEFDYKKSLIEATQNCNKYNYNFDVMYVMVDLGEFIDKTWIKNEIVLCLMKYDPNLKVLQVYPDFSVNGFYTTSNTSDTTALKCIYIIENITRRAPQTSQMKEEDLITKINNHKLELRQNILSNFTVTPPNILQVHLFFEILWAKQFEYDTIYIQYFIDLPDTWKCEDNSQLRGMTQTCHIKQNIELGHFGHVFDITLDLNVGDLEKSKIPMCPYIYFEVISKDSWNRYRTEGLTYKNLPIAKPGVYHFELQCFRLVPENISGQLKRFFIGDCSNYKNITGIGLTKSDDASIINKYGTLTIGTGQIGIRVGVLHQSQAFTSSQESPHNNEIFEKLNSSSLVKSVEQVLQAFKRARKNMIEARKNL